MDKKEFVNQIKKFTGDIKALAKDCQSVKGATVQRTELLVRLETIGTKWFEDFRPNLRNLYEIDDDILDYYSELFGNVLEMAGRRPSKSIINTTFDDIQKKFFTDLIVPIQKHEVLISKFPKLEAILEHVNPLEKEYLTEAIECAELGKRRAAIVLGWSAAVNRIQLVLEQEGFEKVNQASRQMHQITTGRYKRFNKKYQIQNISDLRMTVFDRDLLWLVEFMEFIDGNEHERLGICLTMRDTSAHPGEAVLSEENLLSFFSDVHTMVFSNPKFSLKVIDNDN